MKDAPFLNFYGHKIPVAPLICSARLLLAAQAGYRLDQSAPMTRAIPQIVE
jgi:hypothetical protein